MDDLDSLEERIGLSFQDRALLQQALIHRSYLHENPDLVLPSNERLEFLGDAVLSLVAAEHLYQHYPEMSEGDLTALRAALVKSETLAEFGASLSLGNYIAMSKGEEASGGRQRPAILARTFEALIGAIFLDKGLEATREFLLRFLKPALEEVTRLNLDKDFKSRLQELAQGQWHITPHYKTVHVAGPDHARRFTVQVFVGDEMVGEGTGPSKQAAQQAAARAALEWWSAGEWPRDKTALTETIRKALAAILRRRN